MAPGRNARALVPARQGRANADMQAALSQAVNKIVSAGAKVGQIRMGSGTRPRARGAPRNRRAPQAFNQLSRMPAATRRAGKDFDPAKQKWEQTPASSNVIAPRGLGYYDAYAHDSDNVATYMSIGPATSITAPTLVDSIETRPQKFLTYTGTNFGPRLEAGMILAIVYPSSSATQVRLFQCRRATSQTAPDGYEYDDDDRIEEFSFQAPTLLEDPPNNCIPTRCSFRLQNFTQNVGRGGKIRILRMTTGVALFSNETSNVELCTLAQRIRDTKRTVRYSGENLVEMHQKNASVVDQSKATWFNDFGGTRSVENMPWAIDQPPVGQGWGANQFVDNFTYELHSPSFTPLCIMFEPFQFNSTVGGVTQGNTYELGVQAQFLCHYTQGGVLANMAFCPPVAPEALNKHRALEDSHGSTLHKIRDGAVSIGKFAWNHRAEIASAAALFG